MAAERERRRVERVARAIHAADAADRPVPWTGISGREMERYRRMARAAIVAARR